MVPVDMGSCVKFFRTFGSTPRAVLNTYPWRYRPLSIRELKEAAREIRGLRDLFTRSQVPHGEPRACLDSRPVSGLPNPLSRLTLLEQNDVYAGARLSLDSYVPGTAAHQRQIQFFVHTAIEEMIHRDTLARDHFALVDPRGGWTLDELRQMLWVISDRREKIAVDRETEASATLVREHMARAMGGVNVATVLAPYDLEAHLEAGDFEYEANLVRTTDQETINSFLLDQPRELDLFTEDSQPPTVEHHNYFIHAQLAERPDYELPSERLDGAYASLHPDQQQAVQLDLAYEILNEMLNVHKDDYMKQVVSSLDADTPLTLDTLRGVLTAVRNLRRAAIPLSTVNTVFSESTAHSAADTLSIANAIPGAFPADSSLPTSGDDGNDNNEGVAPLARTRTLPTSSTDSTLYDPLPIPLPSDIFPLPGSLPLLSTLRARYPQQFSPTLAHFPASTVWTPAMAAGLGRALEEAELEDGLIERDAQIIGLLDAMLFHVVDLIVRLRDERRGRPTVREALEEVRRWRKSLLQLWGPLSACRYVNTREARAIMQFLGGMVRGLEAPRLLLEDRPLRRFELPMVWTGSGDRSNVTSAVASVLGRSDWGIDGVFASRTHVPDGAEGNEGAGAEAAEDEYEALQDQL